MTWDFTYADMISKLKAKENFIFSRFGDGEWSAILGMDGGNCDGHPYFKDMGLSLGAVLLQEQIGYMGLQPKAQNDMGREIYHWCKDNECEIEWCNADILHNASIDGRLGELRDALKGREVLFVGPERLNPVANTLGAMHQPVPIKNVWRYYRQIYGDILDVIRKDLVILFSMSMPTSVMINQIAREYGDSVTLINSGSVWDAYCGYRTRRYHKEIIDRLRK